ncbi:MAG: 16S rRNA (cytosine(1402)-N(4))-methyltransferase RsmH [bacterium]
MIKYFHEPVLAGEVIEFLKIKSNQNVIDGTLGGGGHAELLLEKNAPKGKLLGLDVDEEAIAASQKRLKSYGQRAIIRKTNYKNIKQITNEIRIVPVYAILLDLGVSLHQLKKGERGFSVQKDGPLDMRFDQGEIGVTAAQIINNYKEEYLREIFYKYGEERFSRKIASAIIKSRKEKKFIRTSELADLISALKPKGKSKVHPATKVFQALRIATNKEFENILSGIKDAVDVLEKGGRIAIISFHSLEDRLVKNVLKELEGVCQCPKDSPICMCGKKEIVRIITRKPIIPSEKELIKNPRARSAKLRVAEKK